MAAADGTIGGEAQSDQSGTITINAGDGTLNFSGANLNLRGVAATTTISSGINTSAAADRDVTIQGTTIDLDGGITTDSGNLTFTGPVNVNGTVSVDTGNGGGSTTGGNVSFSSTLDGNDATGDNLT